VERNNLLQILEQLKMLRDKDWYIEQYNRNREYSDWVFSYEEIKENGGQK